MPTDNTMARVYESTKTVFSTRDLALIWGETNPVNLRSKIKYYVKRGELIRLKSGIFVKNNEYSPKELATSIYTPSYISFETALREAGMIFQYFETIFIAAKWGREMKIGNVVIKSRKLKDEVLFNTAGIMNKDNYSVASPERAFLDMIYLSPKYYFDNLNPINWEACLELAQIYKNKELVKRVKKYQKDAEQRKA